MMHKLFFVLLLLFMFTTEAYSQEASYCGQVVKVEAVPGKTKQSKMTLTFKEMETNEDVGYTKQLPKKLTTFKVKQGNLENEEYSMFILDYSAQCMM